MKPAEGAPILDRSVEAAGRATDLCTDQTPRNVVRARLFAWLAEGAREVTWALCSLPRERWAAIPPAWLGGWPALRHVRHLSLREAHQLLPMVEQATGEARTPLSSIELEQADAVWDPTSAIESADAIVQNFAATRFELLQRLESASDEVWDRPLQAPASDSPTATDPVRLDWLLLSARQHELQHLATLWRIALNWDRASRIPIPGVPLHPADRLEESH